MKKKKERKLSIDVFYISVFTTLTILAWIGFELFRSLMTPAEVPVEIKEVLPLHADFDFETLSSIKGRLHLDDEALSQVEVNPLIQRKESSSTMKGATESGSIKTEVEEETGSGLF
jgi:hypothetical protein